MNWSHETQLDIRALHSTHGKKWISSREITLCTRVWFWTHVFCDEFVFHVPIGFHVTNSSRKTTLCTGGKCCISMRNVGARVSVWEMWEELEYLYEKCERNLGALVRWNVAHFTCATFHLTRAPKFLSHFWNVAQIWYVEERMYKIWYVEERMYMVKYGMWKKGCIKEVLCSWATVCGYV